MPWRTGGAQSSNLRVPQLQRHVSYGIQSSAYDNLDMDGSDVGETAYGSRTVSGSSERRTLYFNGFSHKTTYRDLLSVIKGGKILSITMRSERSATVSFLDGAAEFLAWTKRNDIYLHTKRVEVKWADRQFHLNAHIANKIANGATRNILIRSALEKGLTEATVRDDMEHIHNLVIIDVVFRGADAYVSTNSIHNALFARTCMMSRSTYKGCKIEFIRDECDTRLPAKPVTRASGASKPTKKAATAGMANRFDLLSLNGADSDEENRTPSDDDDVHTLDTTSQAGVELNFLDSDSY